MLDDYSPFALVADDDAFIAMDACQILEDAGFRTFQAADVDAALAILEENAESIQLLFSDVQMPPSERDGFELARLTAERWPHISIIVASGMAKPEPGAMPEGARFILKPFSADVVYQHLQEVLPDGKKPRPLVEKATG